MINTYANVMRLAEELEQEQVSHAETRKLLLKACNERDSLLESIGHICDSARIAAASELKTRKLLEEAHDDLDKMRGEVDAAIREPIAVSSAHQAWHEFENFHRSLCERFGYMHDPVDWKRDQVSLIEHIASLIPAWRRDLGAPPPAPVAPALDYKNSVPGQINAREHPDGAQRRATASAPQDIERHHQELIRLDESRTDEKLLQAIAAADSDADARDEGDTRDEESLEDHNIQGLGAFRDVFDAGGEQ